MKLQDRVAVITGAGSGIGQAMALLFAREGARVLAADVNGAAAQATATMVGEAGGIATPFTVDVIEPQQVQAMIEQARSSYERIDLLCNNAGIGSTTDVVACEPDEWDRVITVNVKSVYLGSKYAIPHMIKQGGGVIINTASVAGMVGIVKRASYCASKGAVIALTADENTCGITGRWYACASAAILRLSVMPPDQITSGCTMSTARRAISSRKPGSADSVS